MNHEAILKRAFPFVVLALLGVVAYLQARGLTELLSLALGLEGGGAGAARLASAPSRARDTKSGQAILVRNPFDSETGSLLPRLASEPPPVPPADPLAWPDCQDVEVVMVTESSDPWWSLTSLREPGQAQPRLHRVGDRVAGKQLVFIGYNPRERLPTVWLEGGGGFCQSALFRAVSLSPVAGPLAMRADSSTVHVSRATVDQTLRDSALSLRSVRLAPELQNGTTVGVRVYGIRADSVLGSVGIKNGDRLESINGFNVANPAQALEAYARLRHASRLAVHLIRAGAPLDLTLNID